MHFQNNINTENRNFESDLSLPLIDDVLTNVESSDEANLNYVLLLN